jgi:kynurenine 3-monooxygenase
MPKSPEGGFRMEKNALHIWPRHSFMLIALPNLDGSFTCTLFLPFEGEKNSFAALNNANAVKAFFEENFADALPDFPELLSDFEKNPVSGLVTVRCRPWIYKTNALLIGDAAHAIVPFYGQGMNAGFEDCYVLNALLDEHKDDWASVMPAYETARKTNGDAIADLALKNFTEMRDKVADPKFLLRKKIETHLHNQYPEKWTPQYSLVTFSHVPYREAWNEGLRQDIIMERIMRIEGIEEKWQEINYAEFL